MMNEGHARKVVAWRYSAPYDFYNLPTEDLEELASPHKREGKYAVYRRGDLSGFFSFGEDARVSDGGYSREALDVGLGLRPDLTGRGFGEKFFEAGLEFARGRFAPGRFRLSMARFDERAIKVYERAGFLKTGRFTGRTGGGEHPFAAMERSA